MLRASSSGCDPNVWSGRALQEVSSTWQIAVLHQCIRPLIGACCAPGHHGYQRAFELISGQASNGPFGSPVFACAGKTDPPLLSQSSRRPRRVRVLVTSSIVSSLRPVPLFVPGGRSFAPACAGPSAPRARAGQGWPSRLSCLWSGVSRPCLDDPGHGTTLKRIGTPSRLS